MKSVIVLRRVMGGTMLVLMVLGLGFWAGHWYRLVPLHRGLGLLFVCILWTFSAIGIARSGAYGAGLLGIGWGFLIAGLGFTQQRFLVGDYHWIIRVLHLAVGIAAIPIALRIELATKANST